MQCPCKTVVVYRNVGTLDLKAWSSTSWAKRLLSTTSKAVAVIILFVVQPLAEDKQPHCVSVGYTHNQKEQWEWLILRSWLGTCESGVKHSLAPHGSQCPKKLLNSSDRIACQSLGPAQGVLLSAYLTTYAGCKHFKVRLWKYPEQNFFKLWLKLTEPVQQATDKNKTRKKKKILKY